MRHNRKPAGSTARVSIVKRTLTVLTHPTSLAWLFAAFLCTESGGTQAYADQVAAEPWADCASLMELTGHDYTILQAEILPATEESAERCRVLGVLPPEIMFEVVLPTAWNGRLLMTGNGGYAGTSPNIPWRQQRSGQIASRGFVSVYTNTGHDSTAEPLGSFALSNRQKEVDYSFRAVRMTIQTAKQLAAQYYGRPASYSYWQGCSTGGRQGLMEAQRFPEDFDGIIAGSPVLDFTGTQIWGAWNAKALSLAPLSLENIELVANAVYARCDALDGLRDGLLEDPRACDFDPSRDIPQCTDPVASDQACLSPTQIQALEKIYGGVRSRDQVIFPGLPVGAEAITRSKTRPRSGWSGWLINERGPNRQQVFAQTFLRYMAFEPDEPEFDWQAFDFDTDPYRMDFIRSILDATDPDLGRFRNAGGKMLMYFGWADTALNPMMGVNYYEEVLSVTGETTQDFFRLFMVPGMFHCGGGFGVFQADYLSALMAWVEEGVVPERLIASRIIEGETEMTRPLCPYPQTAKFDGQGDPNSAESFRCHSPISASEEQ